MTEHRTSEKRYNCIKLGCPGHADWREHCELDSLPSNPKLHTCPDCRNQFVQPFKCTTCGAQKLYDETVFQQGRTITAQADEIERLCARVRGLRGGIELIALAALGGDYDLKYVVRGCKELLAADEPAACTNDRKSCPCHKCMTYRSIADATGWEE